MMTDPESRLEFLLKDGRPLTKAERQEVQRILLKGNEEQKSTDAIGRSSEERDTLGHIRTLALGLLAPIRRVPVEILEEILYHTSYIEPVPSERYGEFPYDESYYKPKLSSDTPPLVLLRVCKAWHRVVLQTPRIFQRLVFEEQTSLKMDKILAMWLQYSGELPLYIHLYSVPRGNSIPGGSTFRRMATHANRLTSLSLHVKHLQLIIHTRAFVELSSLRILELSQTHSTDLSIHGELRCPALVELYLIGVLRWQHIIKYRLRELRRFRAFGYPMETESVDLRTFLRLHPNLELYKGFSAGDMISDAVSLLKLASLKSLSIRHPYRRNVTLDEILRNVQTPNIKDLELLWTEPNHNPLPMLSSWLVSSNPPLQSLSLRLNDLWNDIPSSHFHGVLSSVPLLKSLMIQATSFDKQFLWALNRGIYPDILPYMANFTLSVTTISPDALLSTLESRLVPCSSSNNTNSLLTEFSGEYTFWRDNDEDKQLSVTLLKTINELGAIYPRFTSKLKKKDAGHWTSVGEAWGGFY